MSADSLAQSGGVFDAHSDILYTVVREHGFGNERVIEEQFLANMRTGGIDVRVTPIYLESDQAREPATRIGLRMAEAFHEEVEETDGLRSATTARELRTDADTVTLVLGMEGAEPLKGDIALLDAFYRLGLRVLGLTHSRRNVAADGVLSDPTQTGNPGGLSAFGVRVVERCADLGIVVDVSHLNERGFWDVVEYADEPIIASHSNCRALRDHPRNLRDDQLRAVTDDGGVVGINALKTFLHGDDPDVEAVVDHIEHATGVVGVDHVGVGFDFYDYNLEYVSPAERSRMGDVAAAEGLSEDAEVGNLEAALLDRGFNRDDIRKLLRANFLRVFERVLE